VTLLCLKLNCEGLYKFFVNNVLLITEITINYLYSIFFFFVLRDHLISLHAISRRNYFSIEKKQPPTPCKWTGCFVISTLVFMVQVNHTLFETKGAQNHPPTVQKVITSGNRKQTYEIIPKLEEKLLQQKQTWWVTKLYTSYIFIKTCIKYIIYISNLSI